MRLSPIRLLLLAGMTLAIAGFMIWPKQVTYSSAPAGTPVQKAKQALDSARAALEQARMQEKLNPSKDAALAVDSALQQFNAASAARGIEIRARLKELDQFIEANGKSNKAITDEYNSLEAELAGIQVIASPTPVTTAETEPNNTAATANAIDVSASAQPCGIVSAAINPGNDVDFFTFTAPAGSRIWIETDTGGTQNAGATSRDTVIDLLAADGTTVIENDDDDGTGNGGDGTVETGLASMIGGRTLTTGGTYFIRVRAFSATAIVNPYRLFVVNTNVAGTAETESNNTAATANPIVTAGSPVGLKTGAIGAAGDVDYYSVAATAGNIVYFNVDADPERDGTGTDLVVEFRDPADVLLLSVDSSITGSVANPAAEGANFTIATSGTYFIRVRHFSATGTGTYHIMAGACSSDTASSPTPTITNETEPNNTAPTANPISLTAQSCAIVAAAINPGNDVDFFTFTAPAGSRIWIETDTGGTQNAGATSRDTVIDLLAADGTTVIENDDDDGTGNGGDGTVETGLASMIGGRTLTTGGTYFIRVRAFSATAIVNPYRLFVVNTNVAPTAEVEPNNTAATANATITGSGQIAIRSGSIGAAGDVDYYSIVATAGNIVYFNVDADPERDGTGTDLVVEFRDPADVLLLSVDSSITGSVANPAAEGANFTIATSGTYFLRVRHFSATGTGTYHAMISTCAGGGGGCSAITCPANVTQTNDPNQCGAVVNYTAPTPTGSCGTITCSPPSGSFFPVGTTTVNCSSSAGPTCSFTVTVTDDQPPSITCPANITVSNDPNQCGAVVNYPPPTITDNCPGTFTATCTPPSGSFFPVGTTTVTCTVDGFRPPVTPAGAIPNGSCTPQTITQSSSQTITPLNSVSCNNGIGHTDNSYFRAFSLSSFGISGAFQVQSIDIGIEDATSGGASATKGTNSISKKKKGPNSGKKPGKVASPQGGGQPMTVNIYTSSTAFPAGFPGSLTLIGTASTTVADQSGTILNVPVTGTAPAGSQLVVEIFTPDGEAAGNLLFIGTNTAPQTGPSYLLAADCGVTTPTDTADIGFPDMHIVMNVNGCDQAGGGGGGCTPQTITQSSTQTITPLNSVSCNNGVGHTDNSYFRAFTLSSFGITGAYQVQSVDIGIEDATSGGVSATKGTNSITKKKKGGKTSSPQGTQGTGQPITVNIYTSSTAFPAGFPGSLTLIGTTSTTVADQSGTILNVPITGTAPAGSQLVVEVFTPDGEAAGNLFFIGSNTDPQTGPSYLLAPDCGVTTPTDTADIGFPDMHIVLNVNGCEETAGGGGPTCTFTVTVNDTQPPVITCPTNITLVTPTATDPCAIGTFTTTASDNCPGVTVVCTPPSGSCFPVGVTTVTCTATDASGNTATCTFTVSVFNGRLQDDSAGCANTVLFNTIDGTYRWCCNGTVFTGTASVKKLGLNYTLEHNAPDRRVLIKLSAGTAPPSGTASLQSPPGSIRCVITDRDTRNDTCICEIPLPPAN